MRIGVISHRFPPEPAFIPGCLAEELAARGHEVRVLTGYPNYPTGRLYPGYRQRWNDLSHQDGVTVRRVPLVPGHDGSAIRRVISQLSYAVTSAVAAPSYLADVDVLYVHAPPSGGYAAAGLLRLLRRVPAVVHLRDVWPVEVTGPAPPPDADRPATAPAHGAGRLANEVFNRAVRSIYRGAAGLVVPSPSMREVVVRHGARPDAVRVVLNWTDERLFRPTGASPSARRAIGHRGRCTVMYAGTLGPAQRVDTAVRAAATLDGQVDLDLVVVGAGPEDQRTRQLANQLGARNVRFLGWRPPAELAELYAAAEYQLVSSSDRPSARGTVPSKLSAALSAGSPVVAATGGDSADLVERARAGLSCPPEDWRALADRFALAAVIPAEARADMAHRARDSYLRRMSMRAGVDQIEEMLAEAAVRRPRR